MAYTQTIRADGSIVLPDLTDAFQMRSDTLLTLGKAKKQEEQDQKILDLKAQAIKNNHDEAILQLQQARKKLVYDTAEKKIKDYGQIAQGLPEDVDEESARMLIKSLVDDEVMAEAGFDKTFNVDKPKESISLLRNLGKAVKDPLEKEKMIANLETKLNQSKSGVAIYDAADDYQVVDPRGNAITKNKRQEEDEYLLEALRSSMKTKGDVNVSVNTGVQPDIKKVNTEVYSELKKQNLKTRNELSSIEALEDMFRSGPSTGPVAENIAQGLGLTLSAFGVKNSDLVTDAYKRQGMEAATGQLKMKLGESFKGSQTEKEWGMVDRQLPKLSNAKESNLMILRFLKDQTKKKDMVETTNKNMLASGIPEMRADSIAAKVNSIPMYATQDGTLLLFSEFAERGKANGMSSSQIMSEWLKANGKKELTLSDDERDAIDAMDL